MTTASKITLSRVLMIPVYLVTMYLSHGESNVWMYVSLAIFVIASLTDFVDGYIARHYNQVTDFGKFLDPLADKLTQFALLLCLAIRYPVLWAVFSLFVLKELFQLFAGIITAKHGYILKGALISGKICTTVLFVSLVAMVIFPEIKSSTINLIAMADGVCLMIAFADYLLTYFGKKNRFS